MMDLLQTWVLLSFVTCFSGVLLIGLSNFDTDLKTAQKRLFWFFLLVGLWLGSDLIAIGLVSGTLSTPSFLLIGIFYSVVFITGFLFFKP